MREIEDELDDLGVNVRVVTFEAGFVAKAYAKDTNLTWPLIIDKDRDLYHSYAMLTASIWDVWGPKSWLAYVKEFSKGRWFKPIGEDPNQRGGDVIVDPHGIVRLHHVGVGPWDRPSVSALLEIFRSKPEAELRTR